MIVTHTRREGVSGDSLTVLSDLTPRTVESKARIEVRNDRHTRTELERHGVKGCFTSTTINHDDESPNATYSHTGIYCSRLLSRTGIHEYDYSTSNSTLTREE